MLPMDTLSPAPDRPAPTLPDRTVRWSNQAFISIEHGVYIALGLLLALAAAIALGGTVGLLWSSLQDMMDESAILRVIDRLLFVLMLIEIFHTVRVSIRSGNLTCEPFLIVGLIATIRRVLVITLQSSEVTQNSSAWTAAQEARFRYSMLELGVLATLIVVMVVSIWILRRAAAHPSSDNVSSGG